MSQRFIPAILIALLLILHGQLWFGRGSLRKVSELQQNLKDQNSANALARQANERLASEVRDLREGLEIIEERARTELGMVRPNEVFVQIIRPTTPK